jgi:signal transduction histidine kinase/CheY-like chemotaxis protein
MGQLRNALRLSGLALALTLGGIANDTAAQPEVERHPLEIRALTEPDAVLAELPAALAESAERGTPRQTVLLNLAKANACRVVADWPCQRDAGAEAAALAERLGEVRLQVRGLIAESRGRASMQDFSRAEQALAKTEALLKQVPSPELSADIMLAYSSISSVIGKHEIAVNYAERGLALLGPDQALPTQARLQRNLAFSNGALGNIDAARVAVAEGLKNADRVGDPKLSAELHIESARLARLSGDLATANRDAQAVLVFAQQLRNTQLLGLGRELLGLNAVDGKNYVVAQSELSQAIQSFRQLGLQRDEMRVARAMLKLALDSGKSLEDMEDVLRRFLLLQGRVTDRDMAQAGDDFEARVRYAEQRLELVRLESEAELARAGAQRMAAEAKLNRIFILLTLLVLAGLVVIFTLQRRANARLRESIDLRSRALTQTSHELRNPIAGIIGLTDLLAKTPLTAAQSQMIQAIRSAGGTLGNLAQDLLDRGRIEAGRLSLEYAATSLRSLAQAIHALYLPVARGKGIELRLKLDENLPDQVSVDPNRLQQVLSNLIGNSLKFTATGHVTLSIAASRVGDKVRAAFAVGDTGPGIPPEDQQQLFEPFAKGQAGNQHRAGAGLGLAISNDLVTLMGGKLTVESTVGKGSEFAFKLDLAPAVAPIRPMLAPSAIGDGISVLVVDDDEDCALVVSSHLALLGCAVDTAASSEGALTRAESAAYHLIFIDVELPDGHGPEVAALLRSLSEQTRRSKIAVLSGHEPPARLPPGVDLWLTKPAPMDRLTALVAEVRAGY